MTADTATAALVDLLVERLAPVVREAVAAATAAALAETAPRPAPPLLTVQQVAERAACSDETVRRAVKCGRLRAITALGHLRFDEAAVATWLEIGDADLRADPIYSFANRSEK